MHWLVRGKAMLRFCGIDAFGYGRLRLTLVMLGTRHETVGMGRMTSLGLRFGNRLAETCRQDARIDEAEGRVVAAVLTGTQIDDRDAGPIIVGRGVDHRVAASVVSGYFSSWAESHKMPWNMCGSQVLPGMLGRLEHVDLGAMVAPRPLLVETGTEDMLFPLAAASASMVQLRAVYARFGATDRLHHDVFDGGHRWHGDEAYPFLDRWLGPT